MLAKGREKRRIDMFDGPSSLGNFWDQVKQGKRLQHESWREFRRRRERELQLLERLALLWPKHGAGLDKLERELATSARVGLERIIRTSEAEIAIRRKGEKRKGS